MNFVGTHPNQALATCPGASNTWNDMKCTKRYEAQVGSSHSKACLFFRSFSSFFVFEPFGKLSFQKTLQYLLKSVIFLPSVVPGDGGALGDHGSASGSLFDSGSVSRIFPMSAGSGSGDGPWKNVDENSFGGLADAQVSSNFQGILTSHPWRHIKNSWGQIFSAQKSQRRERLATERRKPRAESPALASTINEYVESTGTIIYPRIHVHVGSRRQIYELDDSIGGLDPLCPSYLADLAPKLFDFFWHIQQC